MPSRAGLSERLRRRAQRRREDRDTAQVALDLGLEQQERDHERQRAFERLEADTQELRSRIASQWAEVRATRRQFDEPPAIDYGTSNFRRAQVPFGVDLAAAWGWRFLVIAAAALALLWLVQFFLVVFLPIAVALLLTALVIPLVERLRRWGMPRGLAAILVTAVLFGGVVTLLTIVGNQIVEGAADLVDQTAGGLDQIRTWLRDGPLQVTDSQINQALTEAQRQLQTWGDDAVGRVGELGTTVGHVIAATFIAIFATFFFLADGERIWAWVVRLFPRAGREKADSSGRVAWRSLTQFVRATVVVAGVDAFFIAGGAYLLGVPFVSAIAVLVFLGGFIPLIGATVSGAVAVLVALVAQGPLIAVSMLVVVVVVQQLEAHVLQPFLMGRFVAVHPLGVIVAIAMGVLVAGVAGALVAVPIAASVNAVVQHLARHTDVGERVEESAARDPIPPDPDPDPDPDGPSSEEPR